MDFSVHGPFDVIRISTLVDNSAKAKNAFWAAVDQAVPNLSSACGCYIFVIRKNSNARPWYVGLTTKRTFRDEVFGLHQVNHYNHALGEAGRGTGQVFLVAKKTPGGKFKKPSPNSLPAIEFLETFLFGVALNQNARLRNSKNTKFLRNVVVPGVINTPVRAPTNSEKSLRAALGL